MAGVSGPIKRRGRPRKEIAQATLLRLEEVGYQAVEIASMLGVSVQTVQHRRHEHKMLGKKRALAPDAITVKRKAIVMRMRKRGHTFEVIGAQLGITRQGAHYLYRAEITHA